MFTAASAEKHRGRGSLTALTPQPGENGGKGRIAILAHQQADGDDHLTTAAIELQLAAGPVGEMVG
jgi:hypothetical protein